MTSIRPSAAQVTKYSALNNHNNKTNVGQSKTDSPVSTRTIESRKKSQDNSDSNSLGKLERKPSCSSTQSTGNNNQTASAMNNFDAKIKSEAKESENNRSIPVDVHEKLNSQNNEILEENSG